LLIDYILTVSVSIAAGVAAITSAFPQWQAHAVALCLGFVLMLMLGNLAGIRESAQLFAGPTYFFIISILSIIAVGAVRYFTGSLEPVAPPEHPLPTGTTLLPLFVLLTAFSNGCTALTGVEAVSNGVPAFRPPESRNASATLVAMAALAITMFLGITLLAHAYGIVPNDVETVVSQMRAPPSVARLAVLRSAGGDDGDPRAGGQHRVRGLPAAGVDHGARPLSAAAVHESGRPARVFERHSDSQRAGGDAARRVRRRHARADTAVHDRRLRVVHAVAGGHGDHWRHAARAGLASERGINGFGAVVTGVVLVIVAMTKAAEGAWIIIVMIPVLVGIFEITRATTITSPRS
jgi:hypothetical protein